MYQLQRENMGYAGAVVLRDVSLTIAAGERVALVGKSGAGKSTLLAALQARYHQHSALIPQDPALVPGLSVFHNVYMGSLQRHRTLYNLLNLAWPQRREIDRIAALVEPLGLGDKLFARSGELSGGQQQRVAVCRALLQGGDMVLGDEPVSAVDRHQARMILAALRQAFSTVVLALHDVPLALEYSTRIVGVKGGLIVLDCPTQQLNASDLDVLYQD